MNTMRLVPLLALIGVNALAGPVPIEPPLSATSADTNWRYVGVRSAISETCPEPETGGGTIWTTKQLFRFNAGDTVPPGLRDYCVYEAVMFEGQPNTSLVTDLRCSVSTPPCLTELSEDSISATYMGSTAQDLEDVMGPGLGLQLRHQAGRFTTWGVDQRVRLVFVDTEPSGIDQDLNGPGISEHGFSLMSVARDLLCPNAGNCGVELAAALGLPRVACMTDPSGYCAGPNGGYVGTISEVARATREATRKWVIDGSPASLIINLSVAWDALYNVDAVGMQRVAAQAVLAALEDAACRGAIVVAAAGNGHGGTSAAIGPLYPAGWETESAPSFTDCQGLIEVAPDTDDFSPANVYQPLIYASGALNTFNEAVTPRVDGMPRLAAYGDHAVTEADYLGTPGPSAVMSGTSVSAAVVSAAAAATWYYRQDLAGFEIMNLVHGSGELLRDNGMPIVADFCVTGAPSCQGVRRVQICDAVSAACNEPGVSCPMFSCPADAPIMPEFDIPEIVSRFSGADSFDISAIPGTNQATITACGSGYQFFWLTGSQPPNPCPHRQFHPVQVTPWTDGQPSGVVCEVCGSASQSPGVLYIEIKSQFQGQISDITLVCGGDPLVDPGPFDAYRIETTAPLTGGDKFRVDNLPIRCETDGMSLATRVVGAGSTTPASTLNAILIATDRDNDKVRDSEDNCEIIPNNQVDTDGDNIGNRCDADIAVPNDCIVNFLDLLTFKLAIFSTPADPEWNPDADYNSDNIINFGDVQIMKDLFFNAPGPSGLDDLCD